MDKYRIEELKEEDKRLYIEKAQSAILNIQEKISELRNNIEKNVEMPNMPEPYMVTFYIKDVIGIPNRQSQDANANGAEGESYYYEFIPTNKTDILVELRITDHKRDEAWSNRMDDGTHPNVRATAIVTKDTGEIPVTKSVGVHKVNKVRVRRIVQTLSPVVYGTAQQAIQHLNTLIRLFQTGRFGKYKKKKVKPNNEPNLDNNNNDIKTENYMRNNKRTIRLTESDLHRVIKESVKCVLNEGYTQSDINNTFQQWQQQGLQQIRNGFQNQQVRQNGGYNSLGHQSAAYNASALVSKANKLYQYLMKNDIQSASQMLQPISELLETIETDLLSHQRDQQNRNSIANNNSQMQ